MSFQFPVSGFRFPVSVLNVRRPPRRRGFTIIELLVVISILAIIATLATGAAIKSVKQARSRRADVAAASLSLALANYRALHGEWPYTFNEPDTGDKTFQTIKGQNNANVFNAVFQDVAEHKSHVDPSVIFTRMPQGRMTVRDALAKGLGNIPVGYPNPKNQSEFIYFIVKYNFLTDMADVERDKNAENDDKITY
jgi:prepilin-type N-terminal cleavage/methylation domain-containing protein